MVSPQLYLVPGTCYSRDIKAENFNQQCSPGFKSWFDHPSLCDTQKVTQCLYVSVF